MCLEKNVVGGEIVVATVEGMGGGMGREVWGSMGVWGGGVGAGYIVPNWFDTRRISVPKLGRYSQDFCGWLSIQICM